MFTKKNSMIIKGVALFMMMWHHCFLSGRYEQYEISFWPLVESQVVSIANFFKICVSLFAFVSGYGLFLSFEKERNKLTATDGQMTVGRWIASRLLKTLSGYWFVVLCSWIICMMIDQLPVQAYGFSKSVIYGLWHMMLDFFGLSNFFGANPLNGTWWYMSAAIAFILLTPLLYTSLERMGWICTLGAIFLIPRVCGGYPGGTNFLSFLPAFCIGMILAQNQVFEKWSHFWEKRGRKPAMQIAKLCVMAGMVAFSYKLYYWIPTDKFWDIKWGILPLALVLFVNDYISYIPGVKQILYYCGNHSMNVFLIHTFIRYYYCEKFTYSMKRFAIIIIVLLGCSLAISVCIEYLKKVIHYESWINKMCCLTVKR